MLLFRERIIRKFFVFCFKGKSNILFFKNPGNVGSVTVIVVTFRAGTKVFPQQLEF